MNGEPRLGKSLLAAAFVSLCSIVFSNLAQAQALNSAVYIDAGRILGHFSTSSGGQDGAVREANAELKRFANKYDLDIIFQRATYVDRRIDVTDKFLGFVSGILYEPFEIRPAGVKVAFVNSKKLFSEAGRRGFSSTEEATKRLNLAIARVAKDDGIDLVFDNAVWAKEAIDVSERVLARLF